VQVLCERLTDRPEQELLALVDTTAMHRPELAGNAARLVLRARGFTQGAVDHDKIKRRADPGDAGDKVQPAHQ